MKASPQEEMASSQGTNVLAFEKHGFPEDFVSFRTMCGVQWSPLVFALVLYSHTYRKRVGINRARLQILLVVS